MLQREGLAQILTMQVFGFSWRCLIFICDDNVDQIKRRSEKNIMCFYCSVQRDVAYNWGKFSVMNSGFNLRISCKGTKAI